MEPEMKTTGEKIYWAPSRNYRLHFSKDDPDRIGGYQREIRNQRGDVVQVAAPIVWGENVFATPNPELQKVIERSAAFKNGEIVLCAKMDDAYRMTAGKTLQKVVTSGMVALTEETVKVETYEEAQKIMRESVTRELN